MDAYYERSDALLQFYHSTSPAFVDYDPANAYHLAMVEAIMADERRLVSKLFHKVFTRLWTSSDGTQFRLSPPSDCHLWSRTQGHLWLGPYGSGAFPRHPEILKVPFRQLKTYIVK